MKHLFEGLNVNLDTFEGLSLQEQYAKLEEVLKYFREVSINAIYEAEAEYINKVANHLYRLFIDENFVISGKESIVNTIKSVNVIANIFAISGFKTTDDALQIILHQKNNLMKLLALYSPRNHVNIDMRQLFQAHPAAAMLWWGTVISHSKNRVSPHGEGHIQDFLAKVPQDLFRLYSGSWVFENQDACLPYFHSTYIDNTQDMRIRNMINREMKEVNQNFVADISNPDFNTIGIFSASIEPLELEQKHVIDRSVGPLLKQLQGHYRTVLFNSGKPMDNSYFDVVHNLSHKPFSENAKTIAAERPGIIIFPEVGLSSSDIQFSNMRFAPIQITMHGHPVSTGDSCIDYFIGGEHDQQENYTEKLIKLPNSGLAAVPVIKGFMPTMPESKPKKIVIGCNWGSLKINSDLIRMIERIGNSTTRPLEFRLYGIAGENLTMPVTMMDIQNLIKRRPGVEIITWPLFKHSKYLESLGECDFMVDSFPFGGFNRVVDALIVKRPIIAIKADKPYNNFAACLLAKIDMDELVVNSVKAAGNLAIRLVYDDEYRYDLTYKLFQDDYSNLLYNPSDTSFREAIDNLVAQNSTKHINQDLQPA